MNPKPSRPGKAGTAGAAATGLGDRYTLTERIAAGGMGEVWAATDTVLGRSVAVKLLHPGLSQESGFVERFRAEARHTASLHHPNITTVFDYGEDDGTAYLVMELVEGMPLSQIISDRAPLSAQETSSILIQAAAALETAHQHGVVHRDVKPANILITPDGTAKLTDFGISRLVDAAPLTQTGQVLGTAQYLSPEQAMGQLATAASDIYALGVVGHEMLTGQRPFEAGSVVATALAHVNQPPPPLPDTVPVGIRTVISACLAKTPADRPASAAAVAHALGMPDAAFASDGPAALGPVVATPTLAMPAAAVAAAVAAAAGGAAAGGAAATGAAATAQAMPTQVMPAQGVPTQVVAPPWMATPQPGIPNGPARRAAALLLGGAAMVGFLAYLFLSNLGPDAGTITPAPRPTTATSSPSISATPTAVIQPPVVSTPAPRRDNRGPGSRKDDDDEKGGKG